VGSYQFRSIDAIETDSPLPSEIGYLIALTYFSANSINIHGSTILSLPLEIGRLGYLEYLFIIICL